VINKWHGEPPRDFFLCGAVVRITKPPSNRTPEEPPGSDFMLLIGGFPSLIVPSLSASWFIQASPSPCSFDFEKIFYQVRFHFAAAHSPIEVSHLFLARSFSFEGRELFAATAST